MRALIAVPCMETLPVAFTESLLNLTKPEGTKVCLKSGSLIYDARNLISLTAMEEKFDNVLWLDSDMQFTPDLLTTLLEDLTPDRMMVTCLYFRRKFPIRPVIFDKLDEPQLVDGKLTASVHEYYDYPQDQIFPVRGCGFGACLTRTKLLKQVWDRFGPAFAPYPWAGEDISFCHRVNLLGHQIYCDSSIPLGHIGTAIFTEAVYLKNRGGADEEH